MEWKVLKNQMPKQCEIYFIHVKSQIKYQACPALLFATKHNTLQQSLPTQPVLSYAYAHKRKVQ